jgi:hypothetical protein
MPLLSAIARTKKCSYFFPQIPKDAQILEIGCGAGWVREYFKSGGWTGYTGLDLVPPADLVGDIKNWRALGLKPGSVDVIVAFEVIEHVDIIPECFSLLRSGGTLLMTSPVPSMDWVMKALEQIGLNQKRTSPHCNLVDFRTLPLFQILDYRVVAGLAQWGILQKPLSVAQDDIESAKPKTHLGELDAVATR